jgi:antitoxin (DNA-binding transcriptional repressor) of toxin-antitoxin stability system
MQKQKVVMSSRSRYLTSMDRLLASEEITIAKHGATVAKLVPLKKEASQSEREAAIERIQFPVFSRPIMLSRFFQEAASCSQEPSI